MTLNFLAFFYYPKDYHCIRLSVQVSAGYERLEAGLARKRIART